MLISLAILAVVLAYLGWTLGHETGRRMLKGFGAWLFNTSTWTATVVLTFLGWAMVMLSIMAFFTFLGLAFNSPWTIRIGLVLCGVLLLPVTFLVELPLTTLRDCLAGVRKAVEEGVQGFRIHKGMKVAAVVAAMPEGELKEAAEKQVDKAQQWLDWAIGLFDPKIFRGLGLTISKAAFGNAENMVNSALRTILTIKVALLWFGVILFATFFIPSAASGEWLVALGIGIGLLVLIATYMGVEWRRLHNLVDIYWSTFRLVRFGAWLCVIGIIITAATPWATRTFPHVLAGFGVKGPAYEEQFAKDWWGDRFDQHMVLVTNLDNCLRRNPQGRLNRGEVIPVGSVLWRVPDEDVQTVGVVRYAAFYTQTDDGPISPTEEVILFPESKVRYLSDWKTEEVRLPAQTVCYSDSLGLPSHYQWHTTVVFERVTATNLEELVTGVRHRLCLLRDRGVTRRFWAPADSLNQSATKPHIAM